MAKQAGKFFLAGLLGAMAGAIGGILLAPKSGREMRSDIADLAAEITSKMKSKADETKSRVIDIYGKYSEESKIKYLAVKDAVVAKIAAVKTAGEKIDKEKYGKVVETVVAEYKNDLNETKNGATKLITYLKKDWDKMKKALV